MPQPKLIAIAAMASNRVIGLNGDLPWHLPEDLKFFKKITLGHPVLMGRHTFDSIVNRLGKPLPGRHHIVLSQTMPPRDDITILRSIDELPTLSSAYLGPVVYLIGGAQLYSALLPQCDELLLTYIHQPYEGDAHFPAFENSFTLQQTLVQTDTFEIRRYLRTTSI